MTLDARVFLGRLRSFRYHAIGRAGVAQIEQLAGHDAALDPPFLAVMDLGEIAGRGQQHLRRLGNLVLMTQKVRVREQIAGILPCVRRHGVEELPRIAALAVDRDARLRDREIGAAQSMRGAQRGFAVPREQPLLHARLVIGAAQIFRIALEHLLLDVSGEGVVAPGLAYEGLGGLDVALRDERARQHQEAHARLRRRAVEEAQRLCRLDVLDPQHRLRALAEHPEVRPARIAGDEGEEALAVSAAMIAAQNDPFNQLARHRIRDRGRDFGRLTGAAVA